MNRAEQTKKEFQDRSNEIIPSTIKTIDSAILNYFSSLNLKAEKQAKTMNVPVLLYGPNINSMTDRKTLNENGWFPYIAIHRGTPSIHDMTTYNLSKFANIKIVPPENTSIEKTQLINLDINKNYSSSKESKYYYIVPAIKMVKLEYEIIHTARGRKAVSETNKFIEAIINVGVARQVKDPDSEYEYYMRITSDLSNDDNLETYSQDNEEKQIEMTVNAEVEGFLIPKHDEYGNTVQKRVYSPVSIKFTENVD